MLHALERSGEGIGFHLVGGGCSLNDGLSLTCEKVQEWPGSVSLSIPFCVSSLL